MQLSFIMNSAAGGGRSFAQLWTRSLVQLSFIVVAGYSFSADSSILRNGAYMMLYSARG